MMLSKKAKGDWWFGVFSWILFCMLNLFCIHKFVMQRNPQCVNNMRSRSRPSLRLCVHRSDADGRLVVVNTRCHWPLHQHTTTVATPRRRAHRCRPERLARHTCVVRRIARHPPLSSNSRKKIKYLIYLLHYLILWCLFVFAKKWMENKCRVELSDRAWRYLLGFIARAELHLLLRAINVNLQVIVDNKSGGDGDLLPGEQQIEEDEDDEVEHDLVHNHCFARKSNNSSRGHQVFATSSWTWLGESNQRNRTATTRIMHAAQFQASSRTGRVDAESGIVSTKTSTRNTRQHQQQQSSQEQHQ